MSYEVASKGKVSNFVPRKVGKMQGPAWAGKFNNAPSLWALNEPLLTAGRSI